jgi:hypothetical protein
MLKKRLFQTLLIASAFWLLAESAIAGDRPFRRSDAGIRIGASFGFPLGPLVEGATGLPMPAPSLGLFYAYRLSPKWSLQVGGEHYWMKAQFETPYANFQYAGDLEIITDQGTQIVNDTVNIVYAFVKEGLFDNRYLSMPITAHYHFKKGWSIAFGSYVAYKLRSTMTGVATDVYVGNSEDYSEVVGEIDFDESDRFRRFDYGLNLGGNYEMKSGLNFDLRVVAGLSDIFKSDFTAPPGTYRNIVMQATLGYRLGGTRRL